MPALTMTCAVPGCTRQRQPGTGVLQILCGACLRALELTCKGKHRLPYAKVAVREADRLNRAGLGRNDGATEPDAYRCQLCGAWHVGHQLIDGAGQAAREARKAAMTVRANLTAAQLNALTSSWRPGRAPRPRRG